MTETITKDMTIGDVVAQFPQTISVFEGYGLHCVGCSVNAFETLEQGAMGHGMDKTTVSKMISDANKAVEAANVTSKESSKEQTENSEIIITENTVRKVKALMTKEGKEGYFFRLAVIPGGCSGFSYHFDFEEKAKETDKIIETDGLKTLVDPNTQDMLKGSRVDYVETLSESGFKVENPNAKGGCGCGSSFS